MSASLLDLINRTHISVLITVILIGIVFYFARKKFVGINKENDLRKKADLFLRTMNKKTGSRR